MWAAGKVVLVTGSSSGIGRSVAVEFARLGAQVLITGRDPTKLDETLQECNSVSTAYAAGGDHQSFQADLSRRADVVSLMDRSMKATGGKLDILVNNAGIAKGHLGNQIQQVTEESLLETFDEVMEVNLRSVLHLCHLAVPHILKTSDKGTGSICNVSSVASKRPSSIPYSVSKAGLDIMTQVLALQLGPQGIRVNSVNPFVVQTPIFERNMEDKAAGARKLYRAVSTSLPLRRVGTPQDVANYIAFLTSPAGSWITGQNCILDGGRMLL